MVFLEWFGHRVESGPEPEINLPPGASVQPVGDAHPPVVGNLDHCLHLRWLIRPRLRELAHASADVLTQDLD